jgi:hypothetical protein
MIPEIRYPLMGYSMEDCRRFLFYSSIEGRNLQLENDNTRKRDGVLLYLKLRFVRAKDGVNCGVLGFAGELGFIKTQFASISISYYLGGIQWKFIRMILDFLPPEVHQDVGQYRCCCFNSFTTRKKY